MAPVVPTQPSCGGNVRLMVNRWFRGGFRERLESTQLSRSRPLSRTAGAGHEERFLPSRLSAGFLLRKETIAGRRRNGRDAPMNEPARAGGHA